MKSFLISFHLFQICMRKSTDEKSRKKSLLKQFMKHFRIEERLKLYHYHSSSKKIRWPKRLRLSLFSEACEYVKQLQREEIDFSAKIQRLRDHSIHQYNDLINKQKSFVSAPSSCQCEKDKNGLKEDMNKLQKDMDELKRNMEKEFMDLKDCIKTLGNQMKNN